MENYDESIKKILTNVFNNFNAEVKSITYDRFYNYLYEECKRCMYVKTILHIYKPKKLLEFYIPLYLHSSEDKLKNNRISTENVKHFFGLSDRILISGNAGGGKSTLILYLYLKSIDVGFKIPIKVELRNLNDISNKDIFSFIHSKVILFDSSEIEFFRNILKKDYFVFFFDGFDELNSNSRHIVAKEIDSFIKMFPNNKYVITSRPSVNSESIPLFENYTISNLSRNEIDSFVKLQFPTEYQSIAEKIIESLKKTEYKHFPEFLCNPLLLSMFILTFQLHSDIPIRKSTFYDQVFDALFSTHDSISKMTWVHEKQSGLRIDQFEEILGIFSYISLFEEQYTFTSDYMKSIFSKIIQLKPSLNFDPAKLIIDLHVAIGILVKDGLEYTFPHRSIQEYFAALYVKRLKESNKWTFYQLRKDKILSSTEHIQYNSIFYAILVEIDYCNLTRFLALPLLESIYRRFSVSGNDANSLPFATLIPITSIHLLEYPRLKNTEINSLVLLYEKSLEKLIPITITAMGEKKVLESAINKWLKDPLDFFIENGPNIFEFIKKYIKNIEMEDDLIFKLKPN